MVHGSVGDAKTGAQEPNARRERPSLAPLLAPVQFRLPPRVQQSEHPEAHALSRFQRRGRQAGQWRDGQGEGGGGSELESSSPSPSSFPPYPLSYSGDLEITRSPPHSPPHSPSHPALAAPDLGDPSALSLARERRDRASSPGLPQPLIL